MDRYVTDGSLAVYVLLDPLTSSTRKPRTIVVQLHHANVQEQVNSCTDLDFLKVPKERRAAYYYILDGIGKTNRMFIEVNNAIAEAVDSVMLDVNHIFVAHTPKILHESHKRPATQLTTWSNMIMGSLIPAFCNVGGEGLGVAVGFTSGVIHSAIASAINSKDPDKPM
jgi:hypothetical protein